MLSYHCSNNQHCNFRSQHQAYLNRSTILDHIRLVPSYLLGSMCQPNISRLQDLWAVPGMSLVHSTSLGRRYQWVQRVLESRSSILVYIPYMTLHRVDLDTKIYSSKHCYGDFRISFNRISVTYWCTVTMDINVLENFKTNCHLLQANLLK